MKSIAKILILVAMVVSCEGGCVKTGSDATRTIDKSAGFTAEIIHARSVTLKESGDFIVGGRRGPVIGPNSNIYMVDEIAHDIKVFDADGNPIRLIGRYGDGPGEFKQIRAIDFNSKGDIFVSDNQTRRITRFDRNGDFKEILYRLGEEYIDSDYSFKIYSDSLILMEIWPSSMVAGEDLTGNDIYFLFTMPDIRLLWSGGRYAPIYKNPRMIAFSARDEIYDANQNTLIYIQQLLPFITKIDLSDSMKAPITYGLRSPNFIAPHNAVPNQYSGMLEVMKYMMDASESSKIEKYDDYILLVFSTIKQAIGQRGQVILGKPDGPPVEVHIQIYSQDLMQYLGEVELPGRFHFLDGKDIYAEGDRNQSNQRRFDIYNIILTEVSQ